MSLSTVPGVGLAPSSARRNPLPNPKAKTGPATAIARRNRDGRVNRTPTPRALCILLLAHRRPWMSPDSHSTQPFEYRNRPSEPASHYQQRVSDPVLV